MSHIMIWRGAGREDSVGGFWHHGILCTDGTVIHYTGMDGLKTLSNAAILRTPMSDFVAASPHPVHQVTYHPSDHPFIHSPQQVVQRAESRIGQRSYHLVLDNCESFARWCVVGDEVSFQGRGIVAGAVAGAGSLVLGGGLLGAALTAFVVQRFWDMRANRSDTRSTLARYDDSDSDDEFG